MKLRISTLCHCKCGWPMRQTPKGYRCLNPKCRKWFKSHDLRTLRSNVL